MRAVPPCLILCCLPVAIALAAEPLPVCAVSNGLTTSYDIVRGGNVIGRQTIRFTAVGPDLTVVVDMAASLHLLGVRVYNYEHHGEERWRDGTLTSLVTHTDDNGTPRRVDAEFDPQAKAWRGTHGLNPGSAPLFPTSLWNSRTLTQSRLLDRETGDVVAVQVTPAGEEQLHLAGRDVPARKFELAGIVRGRVWYDRAGCWLRALFHTRVDGSVVDIRLR